ncbi:MAG: 3-isopropylmalate dehydratase small subunit [Microcoleaceae cyanobacterium]
MSQIQSISGTGIPLAGSDIDTDRIIPARFLRCVTFDGLGKQVFTDDRQQLQGRHPFDLPEFQGASILVVNGNFGCGSSREHAPQALAKWGIQALVGESFAEIFLGNCVAIGIPCVTAESEAIQQLQAALKATPQATLTVDLNTLQIQWNQSIIPVKMNSGSRQMFLSGQWDSCGQLVTNSAQIKVTAAQLPYLNWGTI